MQSNPEVFCSVKWNNTCECIFLVPRFFKCWLDVMWSRVCIMRRYYATWGGSGKFLCQEFCAREWLSSSIGRSELVGGAKPLADKCVFPPAVIMYAGGKQSASLRHHVSRS